MTASRLRSARNSAIAWKPRSWRWSRDRAESDGYNALILRTALGWREVSAIRALSRYLHQIRAPFTQDYMWETSRNNAAITANLVALFQARLDPRLALTDAERSARETALLVEIEEQLKSVASLDEDRILRRFTNLVQATIRTNLWQIGEDGHPRPVISFKFDARRIDDLPAPRPLYEIFVYSPRVEGIHLRFGKVARGGLRWSYRPQDFRTEILGLVKAQQVKNAVIVPVGAKGGFVPKRLPPPSNRDAWLAEGTEAYRIFVRSLLELTDNLDGDIVVPPESIVRHDGDDPYLVVAADKGTATFSDTANAISAEKNHWLGDAFASGGGQGYDHKKMGITARGAWDASNATSASSAPIFRPCRSPRSASATCPATFSAMACCSLRQRSLWRLSIIATSSSTPRLIFRSASPSASACSTCRDRAGRTTTSR